ncbi:MAG: hypothetical protein N2999_05995 [Proteobacteria bacterium]|nr:hypothetical protein [Pseudomonadota bacterium]
MFKVGYLIEALSPLIISDNIIDQNLVPSKDYITGSALRGVFAGVYLRKRGLRTPAHSDRNFKRLFLDERLHFFNAYPTIVENQNVLMTQPLPFFIQNVKDTDKYINIFSEPVDEQTKLKKFFYCIADGSLKKVDIRKRIFFHNAIDYQAGTTKEGFIFNYEAIEEGQFFYGEISGEKEDIEELMGTIGYDDINCRVGKSRNAQYGNIIIKFTDKTLKPYLQEDISVQDGKITMLCLSDLIISNEMGLSSCSVKDMERYLKILTGNQDLKIENAIFRVYEVEGFVSVWRMRRYKQWAFEKGSSFLLSGIKEDDCRILKDILLRGAGLFRGEGYGKVIFINNKEFKLPKESLKERELKKPVLMEKNTKEIIFDVHLNYLSRHIKTLAIKDAEAFSFIPTPSLLSRISNVLEREESFESFSTFLSNLRNKAKEALKLCHNNKVNLLDVLENGVDMLRAEISERIDELKNVIGTEIDRKVDCYRFYKLYIITLLYTLRKIKKEKN